VCWDCFEDRARFSRGPACLTNFEDNHDIRERVSLPQMRVCDAHAEFEL